MFALQVKQAAPNLTEHGERERLSNKGLTLDFPLFPAGCTDFFYFLEFPDKLNIVQQDNDKWNLVVPNNTGVNKVKQCKKIEALHGIWPIA